MGQRPLSELKLFSLAWVCTVQQQNNLASVTNYVQVADKTTRRQQLADKTRQQRMTANASVL